MMTTLVNDELSKNVNITPQGILLSWYVFYYVKFNIILYN
jgi:hypothetical protein